MCERFFRALQPEISAGIARWQSGFSLSNQLCRSEMLQLRNLGECFGYFGAVCASRRFSRSAVSQDGQTVVVAVWDDELQRKGDHVVYETRYRPTLKGKLRGVDSEWIANIKWARAHCESLVRVVILTAEDANANPRTVRYCYPDDSLVMRITQFNSRTGELRAESV
jgi:hypothetical protein